MLDKIKTGVDGLVFSFKNENKNSVYFATNELFSFSELKVVYLRPFLTSPLFPKFLKNNFYAVSLDTNM